MDETMKKEHGPDGGETLEAHAGPIPTLAGESPAGGATRIWVAPRLAYVDPMLGEKPFLMGPPLPPPMLISSLCCHGLIGLRRI